MARVVIISFQDDEAAEQFCTELTQMENSESVNATEINVLAMLIAAYGKVEGLLAQPTASCPHAFRYGTFKKTKIFGWYVHAATVNERPCFRPHPLVVRNFIKNIIMAGGNNLLPVLLERVKSEEASSTSA